jgi:putative oxidoreductase
MSARTNDVALLAARLAVAALFLPAGIGKLFGLSGFAASLAGKGVPFPELLAALGVAAETSARLPWYSASSHASRHCC